MSNDKQPLPVPENEQDRLSALAGYDILDTLHEEELDAITQLASYICQTPIALISLIDKDRQWFKSKVGISVPETPRTISVCQYTIMGEDLFEVPDAMEDSRFNSNPLVLSDPRIRFYAGMPLTTPEGYNIGTLCVIDKVPRKLSPEQKEALKTLSKQVIANFELKKYNNSLQEKVNELVKEKTYQAETDLATYKFALDQFAKIVITDASGIIQSVNDNLCQLSGYTREELIGQDCRLLNSGYHAQSFFKGLWDTITDGKVWRGEIKNKSKTGRYYWVATTIVPFFNSHGEPHQYIAIEQDITEKKSAQERLMLESEIRSTLSRNDEKTGTIQEIASHICKTLQWDVCAYWAFDGDKVTDREIFNFSDKNISNFINITMSLKFQPGKGLIGRVFEVHEPLWILDVTDSPYYLRGNSAKEADLNSAFAFPVIFEDRVIGAMEFAHYAIKEPDQNILDMFKGIGLQIGSFLERKKTEEALVELASIQQSILNGTDYSIINVDTDGIIKVFNYGAEKMLGYTAEEMVDKATPALFHDMRETVERAAALTQELGFPVEPGIDAFVAKARLGETDTNEWTYIRKNGSRLTVLLSVSAIWNESGDIVGYLGIARDITESNEARDQIRLYEDIVKNMSTGLLVWQLHEESGVSDFSIVLTNSAGVATNPEKLTETGKYMSKLFPEVRNSPLVGMYNKVIKEGIPMQIPEYVSYSNPNGPIYYSLTLFPLQRSRVGILFHDITPLKKVEDALREAKKIAEQSVIAKDRFLANVSHEIRTPMNAIIGFTELLMQSELNHEQHEYVSSVKLAGDNLLSIINDILDFSKIESGKLTIESRPFKLKELLSNLYNLLNEKARSKHIDLKLNIGKDLPERVLGDAVRIYQILVNLVGNAIKFTESGSVNLFADTVSADHKSYTIRFSVRDTGIGIQDEMKENIFERFTQADNDIHRKYGGTGLGLSISKSLVTLMGGNMQVVSEYGKGSEFSFELCFDRAEALEAEQTERHAVIENQKEKIKILLFEDNALNQKLANKVLSNFGFDVEIADNGIKGITLLKKNHFDLVLMDLQMPDMDGYQATTIIREDLSMDIPIIAMTAHSLVGEKEKCLSLGMNDFISKPFRQDVLHDKITALLYKKVNGNGHGKVQRSESIDLEYLRELSGNDPEFEKDMLTMFVTQVPEDMLLLEQSLDRGDHVTAAATAHKLKSSMAIGGQSHLISHLAGIEKGAKEQQVTMPMTDTFKTVKSQLDACYPVLKKLLTEYK